MQNMQSFHQFYHYGKSKNLDIPSALKKKKKVPNPDYNNGRYAINLFMFSKAPVLEMP